MKKIKNILLTVLCAMIFGIAGVFITSCGKQEPQILITPSVNEVEVGVEEEVLVSFKVENFKSDGEISITAFDSGISGEESSSEHITFIPTYKGNGITDVAITGVSGGTATLFATTEEGGNVTCSISVKVKEYSNILTLKNQNMFVSSLTKLIPSADDFSFSNQSTERKLNYYYIINDEDITNSKLTFEGVDDQGVYRFSQADSEKLLKAKEFILTELDKQSEKLIFTQSSKDQQGNNLKFEEEVYDTQTGYFIAEYENITANESYYVMAPFKVFFGIDENSFNILDLSNSVLNDIKLITYATEEASKEFKVEFPFYSEGILELNYSLNEEDLKKVSITKTVTTDNENNKEIHNFKISSKVAYKTEAVINVNLSYKGFSKVDDVAVSVNKQIPVSILVMPKEIMVNELKENDERNQYYFYNNNVGDFGWQEFKISVYAEDSSYSGVKLQFDQTKIEVKHQEFNLSNGNIITNLSAPLFVRGSNAGEEGDGSITLTLISDVYSQGQTPVSYEVKYSLVQGASKLDFTDEEYRYSIENQNYGIYISSSVDYVEFLGIYSDKNFYNASITALNEICKIDYIGKEESVDNEGVTRYLLKLKITPLKAGAETAVIYLDNGRSISATFKIVDVFENVFVNQKLDGDNNGIQESQKLPQVDGSDTGMNFVIRNSVDDGIDKYGKSATIQIDSNNGVDVIKSIESEFYLEEQQSIFDLIEVQKGVYTFKTKNPGNAEIIFTVKGNTIENFKIKEIEKSISVNLTSYNPSSRIVIYNSNDNLANTVSLYADEKAPASVKSEKFRAEVESSTSFNFYKFTGGGGNYVASYFSDEFVYWTSNNTIIEEFSGVEVDKMVYGESYLIGNYAVFDTSTLTLTALRPDKSFVLYANILQYGLSRSFAINVKTLSYDSVNKISTNINNDFGSGLSLVFDQQNQEKPLSFNVTLIPNNATDLTLKYFIEDSNELKLLAEDGVVLQALQKGSWLVTLKLNPEVLSSVGQAVGATLIIAPNDWITSGGQIEQGKEFSVLKINLSYQDGSAENPFILQDAENILSIGQGERSMSSHYIISSTIDMSAYSDRLPLGSEGNFTFNGTIIGKNNAKITGINIISGKEFSEGNYYGLFAKLGGEALIENVSFEGSFDISNSINTSKTDYVGLVAGENLGNLVNVSAILNKSNVNLDGQSIYVGGVIGLNQGNVIKDDKDYTDSSLIYYGCYPMPTIVMNDVLTFNSASSGTAYVGGITGKNEGVIKDLTQPKSVVGYLGYMAYTLIDIKNESKQTNVGAISGSSSGYIYGTLSGGRVYSRNEVDYVGGISGLVEGGRVGIDEDGQASQVVIRTNVRGFNAGLVAGKVSGAEINNLLIEATDNGVSVNEEASMLVKYTKEDSSTFNTYNEIQKKSYILTNNIENIGQDANATLKSYVTREYGEIPGASFTESTDVFFGDFVECKLVNPENSLLASDILAQYKFTSDSSGAINIELDDNFVEMSVEEDPTAPRMFTMFYFEAEGYIDESGNYSTSNLQNVQNILDRNFNTVPFDSELMPINISGGEFRIKSNSNLLSVDANNTFKVKGTGVAELEIISTLNARESQKIYINIINYFNFSAHKGASGESPFMINDLRLFGTASISLYSRKSTNIYISPVYEKEIFNSTIGIGEDGYVMIENTNIKLASSKDIVASINAGESEFEDNASYQIFDDLIVLNKKATMIEPNHTDNIIFNYALETVVNGKTYKTNEGEFKALNVKVSYFEGVTGIISDYDSYVLNTSGEINDRVKILTDDKTEKLSYKIYKKNQETSFFDIETNMFNVVVSDPTTTDGVLSEVKISVDKNSEEYKNRFEDPIFGEYRVVFFAKSEMENPNKIVKEIPLYLSDEYIDNVVIENYSEVDNMAIASNFVIPAQDGLLSITINPADADFYSFNISNLPTNSQAGSSKAGLVVGYLVHGDDSGFKTIPGAVYSSEGVSITKEAILNELNKDDNPGYDGQFYVKYYFGNNSSVLDGANAGFSVTFTDKSGAVLHEQTLNYRIYKKYYFGVTIENKEYDESEGYYLARGLSYKLNIENNGYDSDSIKITTSNSSVATVRKEDGNYYLDIVSREIDYTTNESSFNLIATASRTNVDGKKEESEETYACQIMEFVINYSRFGDNRAYDIIHGMENGNLIVPMGATEKFEVDLKNYLEYYDLSQQVLEKIVKFFEILTSQGTWKVYNDFNTNQTLPAYLEDLSEVEKGKYSPQTITETSNFENRYFSMYGFEFTSNAEHDPNLAKHYVFTYEGYFEPDLGSGTYDYVNNTDENAVELYSEFSVLSYIRGSEESPIPVKSYEDLKKMLPGGHYILTSDIVITPDTFAPISTNIASLDGNTFNIIFEEGSYDVSSYLDVGLFSDVSQDTLLKNITIQFSKSSYNKVIFETNKTEPVLIAPLSARNSGSITNAKIFGNSVFEVRFTSPNQSPASGCYVAGLVANNSGNITNSRVLLSITTNVSLGGLVGTNSGKVASSYYRGGSLQNTSSENTKFYTAGLIVSNSENGVLLTSYSAGLVGQGIYCYDAKASNISSSVQVAGAVFSNLGRVEDCYSNIPIATTSSSSGFVYENAGNIKNCFSTSIILNDYNQSNHYFVARNNIASDNGNFEDCFYLSDDNAKYEYTGKITGINESLASSTVKNVNELDVEGFKNLQNFESFSYGNTSNDHNNVWMFISDTESVSNEVFRESVINKTVTGKFAGISYIAQTFPSGRLELVSANILASSFRELDENRTETENGNTTYFYNYAGNQYGTILNPYVIDSVDTFERYMTSNGNSRENDDNFRFVSDIDYLESDGVIKTHNVNFYGILEGNGMIVKNIQITSNEALKHAGWIASIKGSLNRPSAIMNLDLIPRVVNFPNVNVVGALVGSVEQANIQNIVVYSNIISDEEQDGESVTVSGKNIVGGIIGLVNKNASIKNLISYVGSKANYIPSSAGSSASWDMIYSPSKQDLSLYSYSGGVIGYVYANSANMVLVKDVKVLGKGTYVLGSRAGLVFGGISSNVTAKNINVNIDEGMIIKAYHYGGLVVGESDGSLIDVIVKGSKNLINIFSCDNVIADAVGGITGHMIGGKIENAYMGQSFEIKYVHPTETINYVGGIIGYIDDLSKNKTSTISKVILDASIGARDMLGGIVGYSKSITEMSEIAIYKGILSVSGENPSTAVAGFVAQSDKRLTIRNSYSLANIKVHNHVPNNTISVDVSAIVARENNVLNLENIYTMTAYDVTLENKSVSKEAGVVTFKPCNGNGEVVSDVSGDVIFKPVIGNENQSPSGLNYSLKYEKESEEIDNYHVYNFLGTVNESYQNILNVTTTFKARTEGPLTMSLNQNEQGRSIAMAIQGDNLLPRETLMYGLMSSEKIGEEDSALWVNPVDTSNNPNALSYLKFEASLKNRAGLA